MRDRTDVRLAGKCERRSGMSAAAVLEKRKVGDVWMQNIQDLLENWYSTDGCNPGGWRYTLKCKREDRWYNDVAAPGSPREMRARQACMDCPLYWSCQQYALDVGIPHGTFGGMDEKTRDRIWRQSPAGRPTKFLDDIDYALSTDGVELRKDSAA
jgi:hypothetical protein